MRSVRWLGLLALYVGAQLVGLALANPFRSEGFSSSSSGPQNPASLLPILVVIVVAPLVILWFARRRGGLATVRGGILVAVAGSMYITLFATFSLIPP